MIYFLTFLIVSPSIWITSSINVNLFDFFPMLVIIYLLNKTKFKLTKNEKYFLLINFLFVTILLISTLIAFVIFMGSNINPFLQLYRRIISFIFIPLFIFIYFKSTEFKIEKIFFQISIVLLVVLIIGELVNFSPLIRYIIQQKFVSLFQIVVPGFFRNAGFTGEATYFADLIFFGLIINIFFNIEYRKYFIFLFIIGIISTFSKSAMLSMFITLIIYAILNKKTFFFIKIIGIIIILILIVIWYLDVYQYIDLYFTSRAESSLSTRTNVLWVKAINFITDNPISLISGLGFKGFKYYANMAGAHNQYLSLFGNFGILSIIYYFMIIIFYPLAIKKMLNNSIYIYITIFMMIESFVHEPYIHSQVVAMYMFILSILVSYHLKFKKGSI